VEDIGISIVTASYNYQDYIKETIESVQSQTYTNWELVIVDDGSKDNSVEVIKSYCEKDPRIKLYQHEGGVNRGLSKTVQLGIEKASNEWIAFLESDDTITPNYLEEKVNVIKEHPEVKFIFNDINMFGDEKTIHNYDEWFRLQQLEIKNRGNFADFFDLFVNRNIVPTFSAAMTTKTILKSLNYETGAGEPRLDHHLWQQVALYNKLYYIDKKLTNWRMHPNSYISTPISEYQDLVFAWHFYKLSLKRHNIFKYLPYVFLAFRRTIFRCHLNQGKILLFGKWIQLFKRRKK